MPGPKYVTDFEFPKSFGFTGSATDSRTTMVKSYERAKPRFAEGGQVKDPPPKTPPPKDPPKNPPKESAPTRSLIDIMRGKTRREQEAALGLKKGGRPMKKAKGGPVVTKGKEPGHALQQRDEPSNDMDQESGGRSPLRPGFKKGGKPYKAKGGRISSGLRRFGKDSGPPPLRADGISYGSDIPSQDAIDAAIKSKGLTGQQKTSVVQGAISRGVKDRNPYAMGGPVTAAKGGMKRMMKGC